MMVTTLILTYIFLSNSLIFVSGQVVGNDANRISDMSWKLRQLTGPTELHREIVIVLLPCPELYVEGHLEQFLLKFLRHADVDYDTTRVSMW